MLTRNGSATTRTTLCPQGSPLPAQQCAQTWAVRLSCPGERKGQGWVLNTAWPPGYQGRYRHRRTHCPVQDTSPKDKELGFSWVTPDLTDLTSPRILLLFISPLYKGLRAAACSSAALELDQRQSCSLPAQEGILSRALPCSGRRAPSWAW